MAAVIAPTLLVKESRYRLYEWTPLANGDSGGPIPLGDFADITLKVHGTFGGASVSIFGSLNRPGDTGDTGSAVEEEAGVALVLNTSDRWGTPRTAPLSIWPVVASGDGTTAVTVRAVIRR